MVTHRYKNLFGFACVMLLAIAPTLVFAQPNATDAAGKKQGPWKKYDADGKLRYEGQFKDDKPFGKFLYYYPSGKVKTEILYSAPGGIARTKSFDEDSSKLVARGNYVNEQKDSVWVYYNPQQVVIATEVYAKGVKIGVWKSFYPDGRLLEIKNYKNGILEGPWEQYFADSTLRSKATYVKGKLNGLATYYQSSNVKLAEGKFVNGLREGAWTFYTADGKVEKVEKYKNGEPASGIKLQKSKTDNPAKMPGKEQE